MLFLPCSPPGAARLLLKLDLSVITVQQIRLRFLMADKVGVPNLCRAGLQIHCLLHRVEFRNAKEGWSHGEASSRSQIVREA